MKYLICPPESLKTSVQLPASKSISNRALIINAMCDSKQPIENLSDCDDTKVMLNALKKQTSTLDIGAAGTAMRFLTAYLSITPGKWELTGSERMKQRPIRLLVEALKNLGASISYMEKEGYPPLLIDGKTFTGGEISLDGSVSSQYISALLMIAPLLKKGITLEITGNLISVPYVKLTLQIMKRFGISIKWSNNIIEISPQNYKPTSFCVEADWSAASYWYEIAALKGDTEIFLEGLFHKSDQGDSKVAVLFEQLGVSTRFIGNRVYLSGNGNRTNMFEYDFINEPDLVQTFAVTCTQLNIPFRFKGVQSLKIKETDRIEALRKELNKLGYYLEESDGKSLEWLGKKTTPKGDCIIDTYEDHRMAMAFAPACIINGSIMIENPGVTTKSYPTFWNDLKNAGFKIKEVI